MLLVGSSAPVRGPGNLPSESAGGTRVSPEKHVPMAERQIFEHTGKSHSEGSRAESDLNRLISRAEPPF